VSSESPDGVEPDLPTVTVVIPSVDRPSLVRAVASALDQDLPPLEILVVYDRDDGAVPVELPAHEGLRVIHTGTRNGAAAARQLGSEEARGELVAFLDDDDEWRSDKLRRQVLAYCDLRAGSEHVVVSCRAELRSPDGQVVGIDPEQMYEHGTEVADYLFIRHKLLSGGFALASSTLLCDAALLRVVPWNAALRLHEDWDWVIRATRAGARLEVLPDPLLHYRLQPLGSAASRPPAGWDDSAAWARSIDLPERALGDFLLCVSAVNAAAYGQLPAAFSLARAAAREGRPTLRGWAAFLLQLAPRQVVAPAARIVRRLVQRRTAALS